MKDNPAPSVADNRLAQIDVHRTIASDNLTVADLPPPHANGEAMIRFAETFDPNREQWDASHAEFVWQQRAHMAPLSDIRGTIYEHTRVSNGDYLDAETLRRVWELLAVIREQLKSAA